MTPMKFLPIALVLALLLPAAASAQWRTTRVYRGPGTPASNMCNTGADLGIVYTNYRNNGATYVCRVLNGQYKWVKVVGDDGTEQVKIVTMVLGYKTIGAGELQLPPAATCEGCLTVVRDAANTSDCVVGTGNAHAVCYSDGSTWGPLGGGGIAGNFTARGTYDPATEYAALDLVAYNGVAYVSVQDNNTGHTPDTSPTWWATAGLSGTDGADGREIELQTTTTHIQWRYIGEVTWTDLVALSDLKGDDGGPGADGRVEALEQTFVVSSRYDFEPQSPGGELIAGVNVITMSPVPRGVNGTNANHYLYISGGDGTPEACKIVGGTGKAEDASGQILIQCSGAHTGEWTIRSATAGIQEAIYAIVGPHEVRIPAGQMVVRAPIAVPAGVFGGSGYTVSGAGKYTSEIIVDGDFPLTVDGVFVLAPGLSFATLRDFSIAFSQPDSADIGDYIHWPPAVYAQGAPWATLDNLSTHLAWIGVDARLGTGITIHNCWIGAYDAAVYVSANEAGGDTVRIDGLHHVHGKGATANNIAVFFANATALKISGYPYVHVSHSLFLGNVGIDISSGAPTVLVSTTGFDQCNGITASAGSVSVSSSYFHPSSGNRAAILTGPGVALTIAGGRIIPRSADNAAITVTGPHARLIMTGVWVNASGLDQTVIAVDSAGELTVTGNYFYRAPTEALKPTIFIADNLSTVNISGNSNSPLFAPGTFVAFAADAGGARPSTVKGNTLWGWGITLPTNVAFLDVDNARDYGSDVASADEITATGKVFRVTGTAEINTINRPVGFAVGTITIIPTGAFTLGTSGNIAVASTAVPNKPLHLTWSSGANKWYPSY